jgi:hypothetical protein
MEGTERDDIAEVSNVNGKGGPTVVLQFNWRQLSRFVLLPVAGGLRCFDSCSRGVLCSA